MKARQTSPYQDRRSGDIPEKNHNASDTGLSVRAIRSPKSCGFSSLDRRVRASLPAKRRRLQKPQLCRKYNSLQASERLLQASTVTNLAPKNPYFEMQKVGFQARHEVAYEGEARRFDQGIAPGEDPAELNSELSNGDHFFILELSQDTTIIAHYRHGLIHSRAC